MKLLNLRLVLLFAFCGVAALSLLWLPAGQDQVLALESESEPPAATAPATPADTLEIGSPAPPLEIEHWLQDGNGFFKPVTNFETGKVYVVEFWATWCPPCIDSIPHLAALQQQYRGQGVQIISISDEPLETVEAFLKREVAGADGEPTSFHEITAAYSLTTDPDRSAHEDYMEASQQPGIPAAFIVGKDGTIQWIGHPMELDQPLEQVVNGSWDREAFGQLYMAKRTFSTVIQQASRLANQGDFAGAVAAIDAQLEKKLPEEIESRLVAVKYQLKLMGGMIDEEVSAFYQEQLAAAQGDAIGVARIGMTLYQTAQQQAGLQGLIEKAVTALQQEVAGADEELKPLLHDTRARLQQTIGDLEGAIKSQEAAVASASGATKDRLQRFLDELKAAQDAPAKAAAEPTDEATDEASAESPSEASDR